MAATPPSEAQTLRTIEQIITDALPPGWSVRARQEPKQTKGRADLAWRLQAPDGRFAVFAVEAKRMLPGQQLDEVLAELSGAEGRPVVAAPFLSPTQRSRLTDRDVSYADTTGNLRLVADQPGLFVERQGATKNPWPVDDALRSLRGRGAARAVRALADFRPPYGVRDLAKRSSVPLGSLSRTLNLLDNEGLVTRGERGKVVDLDWERTIRRWAQDYEFARSNQVSYFLEARGLAVLTGKLTGATWPYALTGAAAAQRFAPVAPARQVALYVKDVNRAAGRLRLRPADAGANVILTEPFDPVVFDRTAVRDGLRVVAAPQLAVDLITGTGREPSEGTELLAWMRANEDEWRA